MRGSGLARDLRAWSGTLVGACGAGAVLVADLCRRWSAGGAAAIESAGDDPVVWALCALMPLAAYATGDLAHRWSPPPPTPAAAEPSDAASWRQTLAIGEFTEKGAHGHALTRWASVVLAITAVAVLGTRMQLLLAASFSAVAMWLDFRLFWALTRRSPTTPPESHAAETRAVVSRVTIQSWIYTLAYMALSFGEMPGPLIGVLYGIGGLLLIASRHTLTPTMALWTMPGPLLAFGMNLSAASGGHGATIAILTAIVAANVYTLARASHRASEALIHAEIASRLAAGDLEARVRQRTHELDEARRIAETANRAKSQFLANMSHELRTPLNAIIGYSEMLREGALEEDRKGDAEDHARVLSAARQLLGLVNEVLDLAKIEAGRMEVRRSEVSVLRLVHDAVDYTRPQAEANRNQLTVEADPEAGQIETDGFLLRQCVVNLLSNAAKFTQGGRIVVRVARELEGVRIDVADTGIGIPPDEIGRLFQPFVQVDGSSTRVYGGTGLGLAITHRMVAALGGRVSVRSAPGEGSVFTIEVPLVPDTTSPQSVTWIGLDPLTPAPGAAPPAPRAARSDLGLPV